MDWHAYRSVHTFVLHHQWLGHLFHGIETYGIVVYGAAAFALWLLARPRGSRKWKLASASALASAALGLLVNRIVAAFWHRPRPYEAHHVAKLWTARSPDPSFPSDHASAAFGIAFAVLLFDRVAGALFLAAAVLIAGGRVVVGAHYPLDVVAGFFVGLGCALFVVRLGRPIIAFLVGLVERITDPLLRPFWQRARRI